MMEVDNSPKPVDLEALNNVISDQKEIESLLKSEAGLDGEVVDFLRKINVVIKGKKYEFTDLAVGNRVRLKEIKEGEHGNTTYFSLKKYAKALFETSKEQGQDEIKEEEAAEPQANEEPKNAEIDEGGKSTLDILRQRIRIAYKKTGRVALGFISNLKEKFGKKKTDEVVKEATEEVDKEATEGELTKEQYKNLSLEKARTMFEDPDDIFTKLGTLGARNFAKKGKGKLVFQATVGKPGFLLNGPDGEREVLTFGMFKRLVKFNKDNRNAQLEQRRYDEKKDPAKDGEKEDGEKEEGEKSSEVVDVLKLIDEYKIAKSDATSENEPDLIKKRKEIYRLIESADGPKKLMYSSVMNYAENELLSKDVNLEKAEYKKLLQAWDSQDEASITETLQELSAARDNITSMSFNVGGGRGSKFKIDFLRINYKNSDGSQRRSDFDNIADFIVFLEDINFTGVNPAEVVKEKIKDAEIPDELKKSAETMSGEEAKELESFWKLRTDYKKAMYSGDFDKATELHELLDERVKNNKGVLKGLTGAFMNLDLSLLRNPTFLAGFPWGKQAKEIKEWRDGLSGKEKAAKTVETAKSGEAKSDKKENIFNKINSFIAKGWEARKTSFDNKKSTIEEKLGIVDIGEKTLDDYFVNYTKNFEGVDEADINKQITALMLNNRVGMTARSIKNFKDHKSENTDFSVRDISDIKKHSYERSLRDNDDEKIKGKFVALKIIQFFQRVSPVQGGINAEGMPSWRPMSNDKKAAKEMIDQGNQKVQKIRMGLKERVSVLTMEDKTAAEFLGWAVGVGPMGILLSDVSKKVALAGTLGVDASGAVASSWLRKNELINENNELVEGAEEKLGAKLALKIQEFTANASTRALLKNTRLFARGVGGGLMMDALMNAFDVSDQTSELIDDASKVDEEALDVEKSPEAVDEVVDTPPVAEVPPAVDTPPVAEVPPLEVPDIEPPFNIADITEETFKNNPEQAWWNFFRDQATALGNERPNASANLLNGITRALNNVQDNSAFLSNELVTLDNQDAISKLLDAMMPAIDKWEAGEVLTPIEEILISGYRGNSDLMIELLADRGLTISDVLEEVTGN